MFQQYKTPLGNIQLAAVEESFLHAYMALKSSDVNDIASVIRNKNVIEKSVSLLIKKQIKQFSLKLDKTKTQSYIFIYIQIYKHKHKNILI